jgi:hypothetical protein
MERDVTGNFSGGERTNSGVQASRVLLPLKFRALGLTRTRAWAVLSQGPWLFIGVVLGVAIVFKVAIGWAQTATPDPSVASETTEPAPKAATSSLRFEADPSAQPLPPATTAAAAAIPPPRAKKPRRPSIRP